LWFGGNYMMDRIYEQRAVTAVEHVMTSPTVTEQRLDSIDSYVAAVCKGNPKCKDQSVLH
jgi:hypothetical protein